MLIKNGSGLKANLQGGVVAVSISSIQMPLATLLTSVRHQPGPHKQPFQDPIRIHGPPITALLSMLIPESFAALDCNASAFVHVNKEFVFPSRICSLAPGHGEARAKE